MKKRDKCISMIYQCKKVLSVRSIKKLENIIQFQ